MIDEPGISGIIYVVLIIVIDEVYSRECYNFREEPKVRDCPHGCCGEDYAEYCCDATLQIVGSAIGAALVLAAIIAGIYYCYQKKRSKRRLAQGGQNRTFVTRFGFRTRPANAVQQCQHGQHGPHGSRQRPRIQTQHAVPHQIHLNPAYLNTIQGQNGGHYNYPGINALGPPTAPMPPPYSMTIAPPPYTDAKPTAPPPEYSSVVHGMSSGYKSGNSSNSMPPPST